MKCDLKSNDRTETTGAAVSAGCLKFIVLVYARCNHKHSRNPSLKYLQIQCVCSACMFVCASMWCVCVCT